MKYKLTININIFLHETNILAKKEIIMGNLWTGVSNVPSLCTVPSPQQWQTTLNQCKDYPNNRTIPNIGLL